MKKFNESLLKKSLLAIVIIALSVPATFFLSYNLMKAHAKNAALRDIAVIAELHKGQVCQFLEMTRRRAQDFASDGFIRTQLLKEIRGSEVSFNNLSKYLVENKITIDESIKTIHVLSMEGRVVASTDNAEIGKDLSNKTVFIKGKDAIALAENPDGHDGLPELAVSAPIFSMSKKRAIGVLVNTIRLSELNKMLSGEYHMEQHAVLWDKGRWKGIEVYLVNRDKRMITNSIFVKDAVLKQIVNTLPVVTGLTTKKEMAGFYKDYRGIVVAGASNPIHPLGWLLVAEIDEDEILSFMKLMLMSAPIPAGIIIIVGIVLFITFFKKGVKPLHQISDSIKRIFCGNYNISIPVLAHDEIGMLCESFNNMTRNIKANTASLKKNEFRLAEARCVVPLGSWEWNIVKNEVYWSDEMYRIFGASQQEFGVTYEAFLQYVHPDDREFVKQSVDDALHEGKPYDIEYRILCKDATVRNVHAIAEVAFDATGRPIQMLGTVQDITEHKRREEEADPLQTQAEKTLEEQLCLTALRADIGIALIQRGNLRDILQKCAESLVKNLDAAFARIWTLNKEANALELQSSAGIYTHIDGQHSRIPVGMFMVGLIAEERKPILTNSVIGDPRVPDQEWARQTGMVSFAGYPLTVDNRLLGVMAIFAQKPLTEITLKALGSVSDSIALGIERKQKEVEQENLREQLYHSQKLESVGTLAGGVAHDFNNILAIIIGYGNLLEKSVGKNNPSRIYIQKILKSAERATHLVQGLLAFSRKQESRQKPVPINRILLQVKNLLSRLISEDIVLDIAPAKKDCIVMADSGQMEQVLINLATNARDAMPNGGKLTVLTDIVELGSEFIRTHGYGEIGTYIRISVTDTGMGMDKETQRRIFQPFFTTKEVGKGTGLGLSVVYGIIKQHGGYINVESEPGKGATFRIYLPLVKSTVEEEKPTSLPAPACLNGTEMILLAEDEEDVRNLTKSLLEEAGYKVMEAVDGYDTINKFMENKDNIHLLLLDVIMPTKNGRETYEVIRQIRPDIKALFMSGYSESVIHQKTILEEDLNFISKPFSQTALLKKVREILDNSVVSSKK